MRRGADAAPSRSRYVGLATLVLAGLATSQAVAQGSPQQTPTEPTTTTVATAPAPPPPAPDPKPAPKPDPKPARPKQVVRPKAPPPPPPPPPPAERAARRPIVTTAIPRTAPPKAPSRNPKAASKPPAQAVATPTRRPVRSGGRARRVIPAVAQGKPARPKRNTPALPAAQTLDLDEPPVPFVSASEQAPLSAIPAILPLLLAIGIVLLLGASVASRRLVPWPELAEPLYARRHDLATVGCGVIALAFLWLNAAVLF